MAPFDEEYSTDIDSDCSEILDTTQYSGAESDSSFSDVDGSMVAEDIYQDKNGAIWTQEMPKSSRICKENIMDKPPGVTAFATHRISNIADTLDIFFDNTFYENVILNTNKFGAYHYKESWRRLSKIELKAYIGILIYMAIFKSKLESLKSLWSVDKGRDIFRQTMPLRRFIEITRALHFDDFTTRSERRECDKFCPIRDTFERWKEVLSKCLIPHDDLTVDEQLVAFRGKCPFKQYMPSKPAVYGIKFFLLVDPTTNFCHNISIYLGKVNGQRAINLGETVVLDLVSYLKGSGRNIVFDNFFTSVPLAEKLLNLGLTMLGTIRANKKDIPEVMKPNKYREVYSSLFLFNKKNMLVSYVPKRNRSVLLLATSSTNKAVSNDEQKKPEIIKYYNKTKGGVDTVDRILASTSVKRYSNRWPTVVFFNMLDVSLVNAFYLYNSIFNDQKIKRAKFLENLADAFIQPFVSSKKSQDPNSITPFVPRYPISNSRKRCFKCPRNLDKKIGNSCGLCLRHCCQQHSFSICNECSASIRK